MARSIVFLAEEERITQLKAAGILSSSWLGPAVSSGPEPRILTVSTEEMSRDDGSVQRNRWLYRNFGGLENPAVITLGIVQKEDSVERVLDRMSADLLLARRSMEELVERQAEGLRPLGVLVFLDEQERPKEELLTSMVEHEAWKGHEAPLFVMERDLSPSREAKGYLNSEDAWPTAVSLLLSRFAMQGGVEEDEWKAGDVLAWQALGFRDWPKEDTYVEERTTRENAREWIRKIDQERRGSEPDLPDTGRDRAKTVEPVKLKASEFHNFSVTVDHDGVDKKVQEVIAQHGGPAIRQRRTVESDVETLLKIGLESECWREVRTSPLAPIRLKESLLRSAPSYMEEFQDGEDGAMEHLRERLDKIREDELRVAERAEDARGCAGTIEVARDARLGVSLRVVIALIVGAFFSFTAFAVFKDVLNDTGMATSVTITAILTSLGAGILAGVLEKTRGDRAVKAYQNIRYKLYNDRRGVANNKTEVLADASKRRSNTYAEMKRLALASRLGRLDAAVKASLFTASVSESDQLPKISDKSAESLTGQRALIRTLIDEDRRPLGSATKQSLCTSRAEETVTNWAELVEREDWSARGRIPIDELVNELQDHSHDLTDEFRKELQAQEAKTLRDRLETEIREITGEFHPRYVSWRGETGDWEKSAHKILHCLRESDNALKAEYEKDLRELELVAMSCRCWKIPVKELRA